MTHALAAPRAGSPATSPSTILLRLDLIARPIQLRLLRMLERFARHWGSVDVVVDRELAALTSRVPGVHLLPACPERGGYAMSMDVDTALALLPESGATPHTHPYVAANPNALRRTRRAIAARAAGRPRVGLAFGGDAQQAWHVMAASVTRRVGGISWTTIDTGTAPSLADAAAHIECMDLVLAFDLDMAQLSAALGKTTWLMGSSAAQPLASSLGDWFPEMQLIARGHGPGSHTEDLLCTRLRAWYNNYYDELLARLPAEED